MQIDPLTDDERRKWPETVLVPLPPAFADARGGILPLVDVPMKSCVLISSRKGSVRANHYHRTDWHYCYVLSGRIDYYHRAVGAKTPPQKVTIGAGEMFFTGPMIEHAMVFAEDTAFLAFGRNSRAQEVYEADVVRVDPIQP